MVRLFFVVATNATFVCLYTVTEQPLRCEDRRALSSCEARPPGISCVRKNVAVSGC
jgi:hypothetical protein